MQNRSNKLQEKSAPLLRPIRLIGHEHPDSDLWLSAWLLMEHYTNMGHESISLGFVRAGERLPDNDPDWEEFEIIHVDTGGGDFDHHNKNLQNSSSFQLVAEKLGCLGDPAVTKLLPMVNRVDNANSIDPTSIHYFFTSLPHTVKVGSGKYGEPDWDAICEHVFFVLNTMASKWRAEADTAKKFDRNAVIETLPNGLKFCALLNNPGLRHEAYHRGADVVAWAAPAKGGYCPAVQVSETCEASISSLISPLREAEAKRRGVDVTNLDLDQQKRISNLSGWFLHDSERFLGSGTRTHPLQGGEFTKIKAGAFIALVRERLSTIEYSSRKQ